MKLVCHHMVSASIGDRCTLSPHSVVKSGAILGEGCRVEEGAVVGEDAGGGGCHS